MVYSTSPTAPTSQARWSSLVYVTVSKGPRNSSLRPSLRHLLSPLQLLEPQITSFFAMLALSSHHLFQLKCHNPPTHPAHPTELSTAVQPAVLGHLQVRITRQRIPATAAAAGDAALRPRRLDARTAAASFGGRYQSRLKAYFGRRKMQKFMTRPRCPQHLSSTAVLGAELSSNRPSSASPCIPRVSESKPRDKRPQT